MTCAEQLTFALDSERQPPEAADDQEHWAAALFDRHGRWTRVATQPDGAARRQAIIALLPTSGPATQPPR